MMRACIKCGLHMQMGVPFITPFIIGSEKGEIQRKTIEFQKIIFEIYVLHKNTILKLSYLLN